MSRFSNRILLTLLLGLFLQRPQIVLQGLRCEDLCSARSRTASRVTPTATTLRNRPEGEEGENQQPQDTTKKERKIRKPLESYLFNDSIRALNNFKWHVSRDFNRVEIGPLDTTLTDYRIDYPFYREDVGDIAQGALGQTSLPLNYFRRPQFFDFSFASPYYAYTYNMENVPFYNTKKPIIRMSYAESGQKRFREENFGIMHAQNISPTTGFNVDYGRRGHAREQYTLWSRTKNHNLAVAVSHTGRRYSVHAGYYNNHIEQQENGGVVGEAIAGTTFEMPSGVPMRLADAEAKNLYRNNAFFVTQSYGIPLQRLTESDFSMANLSAVYIGHSFEYSSWSKVYTDRNEPYTNERDHRDENGDFVSAEGHYYGNWFINPAETRDSIYERNISNRFFVQAQPWDRNGIRDARRRHRHRHAHLLAIRTERLPDGEVHEGQQDELLLLRLRQRKDKEICRLGRKSQFLPVGIQRRRPFDRRAPRAERLSARTPLILEGRFSMDRRSPTYWQENLFSNHYIWNTFLTRRMKLGLRSSFRPDFAFSGGMVGSRLRQDLLCVGQQRRPAQRQRQPHECVCSQRFPLRRTSFGQQGIVAVEHGSRCCTRSAFERLPVVLLRILGRARCAAPADRSGRTL